MNTRFSKLYLVVLSTLAATAHAEVTQLDEVVVTAARIAQPAREVVGDVTVIDAAELENQNNTTLPELLARQPGIQVASNGGAGKSGAIYIRGANAQQTVVLIDGVRYGSATTGQAALQHLPLEQIDRIEILRGTAASLYGADAIGGVIQIFTKQGGKGFQPSAKLGYGTENSWDMSANVSGGNEQTHYALGVAYSQTDGISALAVPKYQKYSSDKDGYKNLSVSASASHSFNERNEIGGSVLIAQVKNQYDNAYATNTYNYRDEGSNGSGTIWSKNQLTDIWASKLQAGLSVDNSFNYAPATSYSPEKSQFKTQQSQFAWQNDIKAGPGVLTLAAETLLQAVSGTTQYDVDSRRINSVWGGYLAHLGDVTLQANLRNDDNSQFGNDTNGTIGASWAFANAWQVGASYATGFQAPTFNELYYPGYGNPDLKPAQSKNAEAFLRYAQKTLQASATIYRNRVTDLLQYDAAKGGTANIGKANLQGLTLTADWQINGVSLGGSYDYLDATDDSSTANNGKQLARRAKNAGFAYAAYGQANWTVRVEMQAQGQRFDDAANKKSLAGYALTNLAATWQVAKDWGLELRINNVFDQEYELAKDYGTLGANGMLTVKWAQK
ncbi:TonB-dependent receptor [Chitinibacter bivalviorum]|uniref:TonB-dependent receptor n=1 Tax=Chitinibacter bivalviorum TaxID=2739434 RepID=A0A7H9BGV2_9NEIS|nr:TonB-dependent receptor [Chitinibacter bivalviorum]QLG87438.1 TonB-dependent receptor [Chitinibacter bivalviorum]